MALLQSGVDIAVIALWLGHKSIETTNVYGSGDSARTITCWRSWNRSDYEGGHSDAPPILHAAHVAQ
jgi:integrase